MKHRSFRSFAKINLGLEVIERRRDGYHELKTLFASVSLHDVIEIAETGRGVKVRCPHPGVPGGNTNLAHRAALLMRSIAKRKAGLVITIDKRIPVGGGLGGGSSNAATVLRALDLMWNLGLGPDGLLEAARALGADVPYFLFGGPALGLGRGDEVHPVKLRLNEQVLLVPGKEGVETAAVFRRLAALGGPKATASRIDALLLPLGGGVRRAGGLSSLRNDLERAAVAESPELAGMARRVRRVASATSATQVAMSGSGSSFFLLFEGSVVRRAAAVALFKQGVESVPCRFLSRRSYLDRFEIQAHARIPPIRGTGGA